MGAFLFLKEKIFDYIKDDKTILEKFPLETLSKEKNLNAYHHS